MISRLQNYIFEIISFFNQSLLIGCSEIKYIWVLFDNSSISQSSKASWLCICQTNILLHPG